MERTAPSHATTTETTLLARTKPYIYRTQGVE